MAPDHCPILEANLGADLGRAHVLDELRLGEDRLVQPGAEQLDGGDQHQRAEDAARAHDQRQPERPDDADNPLRLCYTGPAPPEQRQLEIEARFGLRIVCGYAMSETPYGTIWARGTRPFGTLGSIRQHPTLGVVNEGRVMHDGRPAASPLRAPVSDSSGRSPALAAGVGVLACVAACSALAWRSSSPSRARPGR